VLWSGMLMQEGNSSPKLKRNVICTQQAVSWNSDELNWAEPETPTSFETSQSQC
jgi:hypothetical protein